MIGMHGRYQNRHSDLLAFKGIHYRDRLPVVLSDEDIVRYCFRGSIWQLEQYPSMRI